MPTINQLSAVDQINDGDQFPLYSPNAGDARKASFTTVKESLAGDFASLADLAAQTGAGLVGTSNGTTVQQALDARPTTSALALSTASAGIGFVGPGAGATARTVQDKLRDVVSVKDFGAVGDGVTDDTAAFNAAIAATKGEIVLDPSKTYAVNLVITKRGTRINGRGGDNLSASGTQNKNLIPFDPTKPVIQIGNDTGLVGGVVIENLSIWSQSPSGTFGTIGLYLAGGAYGNTVSNVQIGSSFSQHNLKLSGGTTYPCAYNQISQIQLWTLPNVSQIATLGAYYGATFCTANYISHFNITGPGGTGTGYAILIDSVTLYVNSGWVQAENGRGVIFQKSWAEFPDLRGSNVAVDSNLSTDILVESNVSSDTALLPINFIKGGITVDGKFKNAAGTSTAIPYGSYFPYQSLYSFPVFYGSPFQYNPANGVNVQLASVFGASNSITFGDGTSGGNTTVVSGASNSVYIGVGGTQVVQIYSGACRPAANNVTPLGTADRLWSVVYAGTGTINTSDARYKQQVRELTEAERAVAVACKSLLRAFKFNDAVEVKGEAARWHFGVIAQDVAAAFEAEGLNANDYGLFCYDEWDACEAVLDEDGNVVSAAVDAGDRYGIRYDELLAFIVAAL